ncbi:hypothetical protein TCAL_07034 [Tigriopus californicus]|uniref:SET domain-containing protein n=1 Tax=Tigriopus californicus TaxID=6832 RepID=A0A553PBJ7_TIGCA|nr:SET domain-containing protein SmydA-8-like isoform X1 [Tigriopus californicus]XP_059099297.1 SET domain-containing protein SmydA-8-like isoform X1 [Tigriopus californicus]TRY75019.1 hypothetical protein TCAL_07034 [Tigriopus californicus]
MEPCFLCGKPGQSECPDCRLVAVCSKEHKTLHRPEKLCFPFKIEQDPVKGRLMVANRDIQPLELILYDRTMAFGPKMGSAPVCLHCMKPIQNVDHLCSTCAWPFCSDKCSQSQTHRMECSILARNKMKLDFSDFENPHDHYRCIAPLRFLLLRESEPNFYQRFQYLMDHNKERRLDLDTWQTYQTYVNKFLRENCQLKDTFSNEEIDRACGLFWTNAFSCNSGGGQAIFPTFSFMSHSCTSNANHVVFPNRHLALQAKVLIKKGDEITISYISPLQSTMRRQAKLRDKWFFECSCSRCQDPSENGTNLSSLKCKASVLNEDQPCQGILTSNLASKGSECAWTCSKCSNQVPAKIVLELENSIAKELKEAESHKDIAVIEEILQKFETVLHPNHFLLILLKRHIIALGCDKISELELEQLEKIQTFCEEVLNVINRIDPGYNRDRGLILGHLANVKKFRCRKMFHKELIPQPVFQRQVEECMILFGESQKCMSMLVKK